MVASVQYRAIAEKASDAFYRLTNTKEQIQSYVFDGMEGFLWCLVFSLIKREIKNSTYFWDAKNRTHCVLLNFFEAS